MFNKKNIGGVRDLYDPRDLYYEMISGGEWEDMISKLPTDFQLPYDRNWLYNQGSTSACGAHAACGIANFSIKAKTSPRYLWHFVKAISNLPWGCYTRDAIQGLAEHFSCSYIKLPNTPDNTKTDKAYLDFSITQEMQKEASKHKYKGYVRANSLISNSFDTIRKFIYENKTPVIMSFPYYLKSFNGTPDGGEFIKKENDDKSLGHIVACLGWLGRKYVLVDSYDRIVYLDRMAEIWDAWGVIDFQEKSIPKPPKPQVRNLEQERKNAIALKDMIYNVFAESDKARVTAFKQWFKMINALTYKGYTFRDVINWVYYLDRNKKELFDIDKDRDTQIK